MILSLLKENFLIYTLSLEEHLKTFKLSTPIKIIEFFRHITSSSQRITFHNLQNEKHQHHPHIPR